MKVTIEYAPLETSLATKLATPLATLTHSGNHVEDQWDRIPISTEERPLLLSANSRYNIVLSSDTEFNVFKQNNATDTQDHFTVQFSQQKGYYGNPVPFIRYKTLTPQ